MLKVVLTQLVYDRLVYEQMSSVTGYAEGY